MTARLLPLAGLLALTSLSTAAQQAAPAARDGQPAFVRVDGTRFTIGGDPYTFVGANFWYGAYLGADASYGDRDRLVRELDRLEALGVTNLRIAAASEESDFSLPLTPPFQYKNGAYNDTLLDGLDFLLSEMRKRDMRAVLFLNNFWDWTGGMSQYVSWASGEDIFDPNRNPGQTWDDVMRFSARFYTLPAAQRAYRRYTEMLINRTNRYTGTPYRDDPTIMTWELANEPRPAKDGDKTGNVRVFSRWVDETAAYIDSLDSNHLITTGSEGNKGTLNSNYFAFQAHQSPHIDYMTIHLWPKNWGWYKAAEPETMERTKANTAAYIAEHLEMATALGKPLVLEEFGFVRDGEASSPDSSVAARDEFFAFVLDILQQSIQAGRPLAGVNVWGWGGEGRAQQSDFRWRPGDTSYVADPYSEAQGLNSVFDTDASTLELLSRAAHGVDAASPDPARP